MRPRLAERAEPAAALATGDIVWLARSATPSLEAPSGGWDRRIMRRATIDVELGDVERRVARLTSMVESAGGFVASTDSQTDERGAVRAAVTAHAPAAEFARALASLSGLGRPTRQAVSGQDVSIEDFRLHDTRHTFASRLCMAGVDLLTVKELGGWKSLAVVQRYAQLSPSHRQAAIERLVSRGAAPETLARAGAQ